MIAIRRTIGGWCVGQEAAARPLDVARPRVSELSTDDLTKFLWTLVNYATQAGLSVELRVTKLREVRNRARDRL